jgi:ABC-type uncharacterized transport system permease subunit
MIEIIAGHGLRLKRQPLIFYGLWSIIRSITTWVVEVKNIGICC